MLLVLVNLFFCLHLALCWTNVNDHLEGRVIHIESIRPGYEGRWLDAHHTKWCYFTGAPEREVYYKEWTQFKVSKADGAFVNLESLRYPHHYVDAHHTGHLKITSSYHPHNKVWAQWTIECKDITMTMCLLKTPRYDNYLDAHHSGQARLAGYGEWSNVRILAPNPTEYFRTILDTENYSSSDQKKGINMFEGVSNTESTTHTVTSTVSLEIGGAFKTVSASATPSLSHEWQQVSSTTFKQQTTITYELNIPAKKRIVFKQLHGKYGPFDIAAVRYQIKELPLTKKSK